MKKFQVTVEDRMIFTFRTEVVRATSAEHAEMVVNQSKGRYEIVKSHLTKEVPDGTSEQEAEEASDGVLRVGTTSTAE